MTQFKGRHDPGYSESDDTAPMIREDLPLYFDVATRNYINIPENLPDAIEISDTIRQTAKLLASVDALAIRRAGFGPELDRMLAMLSTHAALAVVRALKDAFYGAPS